jgi:hypothetical protein
LTTELKNQLAALQHIAEFSASLRGHELGKWQTGSGSATARCTKCGASLRVYFPALQPEMNGPALSRACETLEETAA